MGRQTRKEAEGDDHQTDCVYLPPFSTQRRLPPHSSLLSNLKKWRPELHSTPLNQLASISPYSFIQNPSAVTCRTVGRARPQASLAVASRFQSYVLNTFRSIACLTRTSMLCRRGMSTQPPAERASEIIDKLPSSPNLLTKTGSVILGSGLVATAISQELYVMNEETVIAVGFFLLLTFIAKVRSAI